VFQDCLEIQNLTRLSSTVVRSSLIKWGKKTAIEPDYVSYNKHNGSNNQEIAYDNQLRQLISEMTVTAN
jgi:hypothetical protein